LVERPPLYCSFTLGTLFQKAGCLNRYTPVKSPETLMESGFHKNSQSEFFYLKIRNNRWKTNNSALSYK